MDKLIAHEQSNLIVDLAEHYYTNWVKETQEYDLFFFKICKLAFSHGSEEHRYSFIKRMIKSTSNKDSALSEMLAEAYEKKGDYSRAYYYSIIANKPHMTCELMLTKIINLGYVNEGVLFKLRTVFEYLAHGLIESAKT